MKFNRNPVILENESPYTFENSDIKATPSLWNCDLDAAIRYGGSLTRAVLESLTLVGDRKYVTVDTKIHMLMPGMIPAIPGWHTDGVPRQYDGTPHGGSPKIHRQEELDAEGLAPRYHLLITGDFCSTEFMDVPWEWSANSDPRNSSFYAAMTREVNIFIPQYAEAHHKKPTWSLPGYQWVRWDWWNIHQAVRSTDFGWRFLIRVTESDFLPPQTDPREFIRVQNQVYLPSEYGW